MNFCVQKQVHNFILFGFLSNKNVVKKKKISQTVLVLVELHDSIIAEVLNLKKT